VTVEANIETLLDFTEMVAVFSFFITPEYRSGNGHLSPYRPLSGTWRGLVYRGLWKTDERELWKRSVSRWDHCEGNPDGGFLYLRPRETYNGSLWKRSFSFTGLHKENVSHLEKVGGGGRLANMFIGPEPVLDIFLCYE